MTVGPFLPEGLRFERPDWLLAFYGLPVVVLLYLLRRRAARLLVPHLPLWEKVLDRFRRRSHWSRTVFSILLQLVIFSLAILAAAGPYRLAGRPGRGHTVLILDRSLGTRAVERTGRPLSEAVLERGRAALAAALRDGPVSLAWLQGGLRARVTASTEAWRFTEALADPGVPQEGRPVDEVLGLAADLGAGSRLALVTPFDPGAGARQRLAAAGVALLAAGAPEPQAGIVSVVRAGPRELRVRVAGDGGERELQLQREERVVASTPVTPRPEGVEVPLALPIEAGARPRLALDPPDGFPDDDRADLALPERERLRLLVVADGLTPFLDASLDAFRTAGEVLDVEGSGRIGSARFREVASGYDVVVLVGVDCGLPLPPGRYVLLGSRAPDLPIVREAAAAAGPAQPIKVRSEDPLVRALDLSEWALEKVAPARAQAGLDVVVDGSQGPLISRGEAGDVRFVDIAVVPDPAVSTLPLLNAFPLLLEAALLELVGLESSDRPPVLPIDGVLDLRPGEDPVLRTPTGASLPLPPLPEGTGYRLPERPGFYQVGTAAEARTISLAVLDHPGRPGAALRAAGELRAFTPVEQREDFQTLLLAVLGGALLLEWILYHRLLTD